MSETNDKTEVAAATKEVEHIDLTKSDDDNGEVVTDTESLGDNDIAGDAHVAATTPVAGVTDTDTPTEESPIAQTETHDVADEAVEVDGPKGEAEDAVEVDEPQGGAVEVDEVNEAREEPVAATLAPTIDLTEVKEALKEVEHGEEVEEDDIEAEEAKEDVEISEASEDASSSALDETEPVTEADNEKDAETPNQLDIPQSAASDQDSFDEFGEFEEEDEFGDFDDFEEMEHTPPVEEVAAASTTSVNTVGGGSASGPAITSILKEDAFTSFTSLSFAAKTVMEDNGMVQSFAPVDAAAAAAGSRDALANFQLTESAAQIYSLLCSVPNNELNFLKSFTRRILLKDLGVPLDLDELLPRKEKKHFIIRRSQRSMEKSRKSGAEGDGAANPANAATEGKRGSDTPRDDSTSGSATPMALETEMKLDAWSRLVEIRKEQRERMEVPELQELVVQLKEANEQAKEVLKQWTDKLELGYKNKEAFEAVVENMVGFAQKQRLKKGAKKK